MRATFVVMTTTTTTFKFKSTSSKANRGAFFQDEPKLTNQYKEDAYLREHLKLVIPAQVQMISLDF
jgi:chloramphenicol O-acetyltransferase